MLEKRHYEPVTHDTFVLPSNVKNLTNKKVDELWQKRPKDPINVRMWLWRTLNQCFIMLNMC